MLLINFCDTPMDIPDAIWSCDISYPTVDTVRIVFFFKNNMRVAITFTHDNNAMYIVSTQWTDIEPVGARVRAPERDQNVMIENIKIVDAPGNPLLFTGHIDVSRRYLTESFECTRTPVAMLIEPSCSLSYESANDSAIERPDEDDVLVLDTDESDSDTGSDNMVPDTDTDESADESDSDTDSENMVPDTDTDNDEILVLD